MGVKIIKGDLFDAPKGSIICHAVNCQGVWGSGIAAKFRQRYPEAYRLYRLHCEENKDELLGTCLLILVDGHTIGCLFTSDNYGIFKDREKDILHNTRLAVKNLIQNSSDNPIHMCKINSGLFGVPWEKTQAVLKTFDDVGFTVYEF